MASIADSSTENDSDDGYISTEALEDIPDGSQIHLELNTRDARFKIHDRIRQTKS